jgi:hypothetical protein
MLTPQNNIQQAKEDFMKKISELTKGAESENMYTDNAHIVLYEKLRIIEEKLDNLQQSLQSKF